MRTCIFFFPAPLFPMPVDAGLGSVITSVDMIMSKIRGKWNFEIIFLKVRKWWLRTVQDNTQRKGLYGKLKRKRCVPFPMGSEEIVVPIPMWYGSRISWLPRPFFFFLAPSFFFAFPVKIPCCSYWVVPDLPMYSQYRPRFRYRKLLQFPPQEVLKLLYLQRDHQSRELNNHIFFFLKIFHFSHFNYH